MGTVNALDVAANHPAYAGHFPGQPLLPGVVLLDAALRQIAVSTATQSHEWRIASAKFHSPVGPGTALSLEQELQPDGSLRFAVSMVMSGSTQIVASGLLQPQPVAKAPA